MRPPPASFFSVYPFAIRGFNDHTQHGWLQEEFRSADRAAALREGARIEEYNRRLRAQQAGDPAACERPVVNEHLSPAPLTALRPLPAPAAVAGPARTHAEVCDDFCDRIDAALDGTRVHVRNPALFRRDIQRLFHMLSYAHASEP